MSVPPPVALGVTSVHIRVTSAYRFVTKGLYPLALRTNVVQLENRELDVAMMVLS
jgi:hypothetical protein